MAGIGDGGSRRDVVDGVFSVDTPQFGHIGNVHMSGEHRLDAMGGKDACDAVR